MGAIWPMCVIMPVVFLAGINHHYTRQVSTVGGFTLYNDTLYSGENPSGFRRPPPPKKEWGEKIPLAG